MRKIFQILLMSAITIMGCGKSEEQLETERRLNEALNKIEVLKSANERLRDEQEKIEEESGKDAHEAFMIRNGFTPSDSKEAISQLEWTNRQYGDFAKKEDDEVAVEAGSTAPTNGIMKVTIANKTRIKKNDEWVGEGEMCGFDGILTVLKKTEKGLLVSGLAPKNKNGSCPQKGLRTYISEEMFKALIKEEIRRERAKRLAAEQLKKNSHGASIPINKQQDVKIANPQPVPHTFQDGSHYEYTFGEGCHIGNREIVSVDPTAADPMTYEEVPNYGSVVSRGKIGKKLELYEYTPKPDKWNGGQCPKNTIFLSAAGAF